MTSFATLQLNEELQRAVNSQKGQLFGTAEAIIEFAKKDWSVKFVARPSEKDSIVKLSVMINNDHNNKGTVLVLNDWEFFTASRFGSPSFVIDQIEAELKSQIKK